jgi:hypothetical protein
VQLDPIISRELADGGSARAPDLVSIIENIFDGQNERLARRQK